MATRPENVNGLAMSPGEADREIDRIEAFFRLLPETPQITPAGDSSYGTKVSRAGRSTTPTWPPVCSSTIERRVGKLLGQNSRAAGLYVVSVTQSENGQPRVRWKKVEAWRQWAEISEGCYLLRSNIRDWSAEQFWEAYVQLTQAAAAFRIHKSDLEIRPVWHQKKERVEAHILVCFLAYVLRKTLGQLCSAAGLGGEPGRLLAELSVIQTVDRMLPARQEVKIRQWFVARPDRAILLQRLELKLPETMDVPETTDVPSPAQDLDSP